MQFTNLKSYPIQAYALECALPVYVQKLRDCLRGIASHKNIVTASGRHLTLIPDKLLAYDDSLSRWTEDYRIGPISELIDLQKLIKHVNISLAESEEWKKVKISSEFNLYKIALEVKDNDWEEFFPPALASITVLQALDWITEDCQNFREPFLRQKIDAELEAASRFETALEAKLKRELQETFEKTGKINELVIYQSESGSIEVQLNSNTVWLRQEQLSTLFGRDRSVITKHIRNVFAEGELARYSACANFAHTAADGKTYQVEHYNLDVIISVGYRVKSIEGTRFRQWATSALRQHLTQGYSLNKQRLEANAIELEAALLLVRKIAQNPALAQEEGRGLLDVVTRYARTYLLLQRYDEGLLADPVQQPGGNLPSIDEARTSLAKLKTDLMSRSEATDLFARERDSGLDALLGNLNQTVFGEPAYPTIESKAAHLLYFTIKNHPFADGNKRSGAFLFVDFLARNGRLLDNNNQPVINDIGLAALALLVAESDPKQKETIIRLIINMLARN